MKEVEFRFDASGWWMIAAALALVLVTVFAPSCCSSSELQKQAQLSEERVSAFVALMEDAQTDRPTEQAFIKACGGMFTAMRESTGAEPLGGSNGD